MNKVGLKLQILHEYKFAEYQEMNTDGLKTADNWQATGVEEWPKLDFFLSGGFAHRTVVYQRFVSYIFSVVTLHKVFFTLCILYSFFTHILFYFALYCICALYIGHFPWWLCKRYFVHCVFIYFVVNFFLIFCTCIFALYIWFFCGEFAHHTSYIGLCILYFSHCYTVYLCSVHCIFLLFLRWVCASRLICCQDPPQVPKLPITTWEQRHLSSKYK